ncbi:hypothetical protein C7534_11487 [Pseudomonas sp. OV226]|jgi:hypothetical protein|nr:hypothetical protein C7534_11487 [Pseudomonas sp. OV226]
MIWRGAWSRCNPDICVAPIREQARSHIGFLCTQILWLAQFQCGSGLAREAFKGRKEAVC